MKKFKNRYLLFAGFFGDKTYKRLNYFKTSVPTPSKAKSASIKLMKKYDWVHIVDVYNFLDKKI